MCGRYSLWSADQIGERFDITSSFRAEPKYNIIPGANMPVIVREDKNKLAMMKWGLIPFWSRDPKIGFKMINARAEGIENKPAYRKPIRSNRCLIPANGFFEWKKLGLTKLAPKVPYFIHLRDESLFAFAGIYDSSTQSYSIITTAPNPLIATIHDRMPVILKRRDEDIWLNNDTDLMTVLKLLAPFPDREMEIYPVSTDVNSPAVNDESLIEPLMTN